MARTLVRTAVTDDPIDVSDVLARVGAPDDGAVLLFLGIVRNHNDGRAVGGMEYEAYREMADAVLSEIAGETAERWGTDRVVVVHRIGALEIGEASVAIAVSTPHRGEAYDASRYVIEEIKERVPVWKKERYEDGERRWVPGHRPRGARPDDAGVPDKAGRVGESSASGASAPTGGGKP